MASVQTSKGKFKYQKRNIYISEKKFDRAKAFENLSLLVDVLNKEGIVVSPAYGTLLGIIRENNFIEWDHDIDLFILKEDKEKFLNALWDLRKVGFELFREERCGYLYSIMRSDHYIDFYIMEKISPEVRTSFGEFFVLDRFLTDLRDWDFRGLSIKIPKDYEECLDFLYGDWRIPVEYPKEEYSKLQKIKIQLIKWIKSCMPQKMRFEMQKKHHKIDLEKFLVKCNKKGVVLKYEINYK